MSARHRPKFLRPADPDKCHEVAQRSLVSTASARVLHVGKPFDFGRHLSQDLKLRRRQATLPQGSRQQALDPFPDLSDPSSVLGDGGGQVGQRRSEVEDVARRHFGGDGRGGRLNCNGASGLGHERCSTRYFNRSMLPSRP